MTEIRDLDKELGLMPDNPKAIPTKRVHMFGRDWTIRCDVNSYTVSMIVTGDASQIAPFITNLIAEDERMNFAQALNAVPDLDIVKLVNILNVLIEEAGERPTAPPSTSRTSASKRTSGRNSTAGSSSARVRRAAS